MSLVDPDDIDRWMGDYGPRLGGVPGGCNPVPLSDPIILFDTRGWEPDWAATPPADVGSGSPTLKTYAGRMLNQGTGGSMYDLFAFCNSVAVTPKGGIRSFWSARARAWPNEFATTGEAPWPETWADLGGDPCDGPFTVMCAIGAIDSPSEDEGGFDRYLEADFMTGWGPGGIDLYETLSIFFLDPIGAGPPTEKGYDSFAGQYLANEFIEWYPGQAEPPDSIFPEMARRLLTITVDPRCQEAWFWLDDRLILSVDAEDDTDNMNRSFSQFMRSCIEDSGEPAGIPDDITQLFMYFGEHQSSIMPDEDPTGFFCPGVPWAGPVGWAFFRGSPSEADLSDWYDFWFPAGQNYPGTIGPGAVTRSGLAFTDPHSWTYTVPAGVDRLRFLMTPSSGAGGVTAATNPRIRFDVAVSAGDDIEIQLGGGGTNGGASSGLGGWPDGGRGGNNATVGRRGGGGGGSSRVWHNGVLIAVLAGGGGGGYFGTTPQAPWRGGAVGSGTVDTPPSDVGNNGWTNNVDTAAASGKAASAGAPGAAGTNGIAVITNATAGVGSQGGEGVYFNNAQPYSGGGGGGGGLFGGGGGGVAVVNTPGSGGGAGVHWFDAACLDVMISQVGVGFQHGAAVVSHVRLSCP